MSGRIVLGDNLDVLPTLADASFDLVYIDPPFNTGREQRRTTLRVQRDAEGDRVGFGGHRYRSVVLGSVAFADPDRRVAFAYVMNQQRLAAPGNPDRRWPALVDAVYQALG